MAIFTDLAEKKNILIRKPLDLSLFVAPFSADPITDLTGSDSSLAALPTGYEDGGYMTDDGLRFAREAETSDVTSAGRVEPTRSDTVSDVTSLQVDFQQLSRVTVGLYTGQDMSTVVPDPVSGEIQIAKPARPVSRYYRLLALAVDQTDDGELYLAKFFPRAKITDWAEQAWAKGDDAINWGMTFTAYVDDELGYSQKDIFAGPAWEALIFQMGFDVS